MARTKGNPQIILRPQDLLVLLRHTLAGDEAPSYAALAADLGLTASAVHAAVERAMVARLARKDAAGRPRVLLEPLRLFVQHGARYCFPATRGVDPWRTDRPGNGTLERRHRVADSRFAAGLALQGWQRSR